MNIKNKILFAFTKKWIPTQEEYIKNIFYQYTVDFVDGPEMLRSYLSYEDPCVIFFLHWSCLIPSSIFEKHNCIIFHMTDLPFGRGGSPLQNLIARGIYETKISAIKCIEELDAGDIYLKKNLSLRGNAEEIYCRSTFIMIEMAKEVLEKNIVPVPQSGEVVSFMRRKKEESNISHISDLNHLYDYIRMLDASGYPSAFLETDKIRIEFSRASFKIDHILADVKITIKKEGV